MRRLLLAATALALAACGSDSPSTPTPPAPPPAPPPNPTIANTTFAPSLGVNLAASTQLGTGVYIRDITVGTGPLAPTTGNFSYYLVGALPTGTQFDEAAFPAAPRRTAIDGLIPGLRDGIAGMRVGGRRQIIIPVERGFGANPPAGVPANAILVYDVALPVVDNAVSNPAFNLSQSFTSTPTGTAFRDLSVGNGATVAAGQNITFHYTLWLPNGTQVETLQPPSAPAQFNLNQLILGWRDAVPGMRVGGTRQLIIPPERGYGANPPPGIPANSVLIFTVSITAAN